MRSKAEDLLAELTEAQSVIGDTVWANFLKVQGLPADLPQELTNVAAAARARRNKIDAAASALSELIADGYPSPINVALSEKSKAQINAIVSNMKAFLGIA